MDEYDYVYDPYGNLAVDHGNRVSARTPWAAGNIQGDGVQERGDSGLAQLGGVGRYLWGGQNDYRAQVPWLQTQRSEADAQLGQNAVNQQLAVNNLFAQAGQGQGALGGTMGRGAAMMAKPQNFRGIDPITQRQILAKQAEAEQRTQQMLAAQLREQATQSQLAGQLSARDYFGQNRSQSLQEAIANQKAAGQVADMNVATKRENEERESKGAGALFSGIGSMIGGIV